MDIKSLSNDIDLLIKYSRYYLYSSDKEYLENIKKLKKLKKHIENEEFNEFLKRGNSE